MNWIQCLDRFAVLWILLTYYIQCVIIPDSTFLILQTSFIVHSSNREWIYCILDTVHTLEQRVQLCKLFEYIYADIFCDWISKGSQDKDISCYQTLNRSQDTDICVLVDTGRIIGQITGQIAGCSGQTSLSVTVVTSDGFHYCIILCTIESIPVDCNHYF